MASAFAVVAEAFRQYGQFMLEMSNETFNHQLLLQCAEALQSTQLTTVHRLLQPYTSYTLDQLRDQAVPARFTGALHYLSLQGVDQQLTSLYTGWPTKQLTSSSGAELWAVVSKVIEQHVDTITDFMQYEPQTNEVQRSVPLLLGFLYLARRFPQLPLVCYEVGASAGLNTMWHQFSYTLQTRTAQQTTQEMRYGSKDSPVHLTSEFRSSIPTRYVNQQLQAEAVYGCDRHPVDLSLEKQRLRLQAYVWPCQVDRLQRLKAALELAQRQHLQVQQADAGDFVCQRMQLHEGKLTVLYHTAVWQYLDVATRTKIESHVHSLGAAATEQQPVAWLAVESSTLNNPSTGSPSEFEVAVRYWPHDCLGADNRIVLAECHPHGSWIKPMEHCFHTRHALQVNAATTETSSQSIDGVAPEFTDWHNSITIALTNHPAVTLSLAEVWQIAHDIVTKQPMEPPPVMITPEQADNALLALSTSNSTRDLSLLMPFCVPFQCAGMSSVSQWLYVSQHFTKHLISDRSVTDHGWWVTIGARLLRLQNGKDHSYYVNDHGPLGDVVRQVKDFVLEQDLLSHVLTRLLIETEAPDMIQHLESPEFRLELATSVVADMRDDSKTDVVRNEYRLFQNPAGNEQDFVNFRASINNAAEVAENIGTLDKVVKYATAGVCEIMDARQRRLNHTSDDHDSGAAASAAPIHTAATLDPTSTAAAAAQFAAGTTNAPTLKRVRSTPTAVRATTEAPDLPTRTMIPPTTAVATTNNSVITGTPAFETPDVMSHDSALTSTTPTTSTAADLALTTNRESGHPQTGVGQVDDESSDLLMSGDEDQEEDEVEEQDEQAEHEMSFMHWLVLRGIIAEVNTGNQDLMDIIRSKHKYGSKAIGDTYPQFRAAALTAIQHGTPSTLLLDIMWVLVQGDMGAVPLVIHPKKPSLHFLPNLVGAWFVAEVARNRMSMLTSLMILDMMQLRCEKYTWTTVLWHTREGTLTDLYGDAKPSDRVGGLHPMAHYGSVEDTRQLFFYTQTVNAQGKQTKSAWKTGAKVARQKEAQLMLDYIAAVCEQHNAGTVTLNRGVLSKQEPPVTSAPSISKTAVVDWINTQFTARMSSTRPLVS